MKIATVAFYGCTLGLLAMGLRELLSGFEENRCSMTYMFEYPEYRVSNSLAIYPFRDASPLSISRVSVRDSLMQNDHGVMISLSCSWPSTHDHVKMPLDRSIRLLPIAGLLTLRVASCLFWHFEQASKLPFDPSCGRVDRPHIMS